jgi:hypothetical protein
MAHQSAALRPEGRRRVNLGADGPLCWAMSPVWLDMREYRDVKFR